MAKAMWSGDSSRKVVKRIVVEGELTLITAAHFGNGEEGEMSDMPLLTDAYDGRSPLLTGASLAGALRGYLRVRGQGYNDEHEQGASVLLFGGSKADEEGEQSPLIVEDSLGRSNGVEIRHGVRLEPTSRTADHDKLYDLELWQAGARFPLRFELLVRETESEAALCRALASALTGLENGGITLGARKRRGYGQVRAGNWRVACYDLTDPAQLLAWITSGYRSLPQPGTPENSIVRALGVSSLLPDHLARLSIQATFRLNGSLLIRSGSGTAAESPDTVHLRARYGEAGSIMPILSGTSLAGALRARAYRIARTLSTEARAEELTECLFGSGPGRRNEVAHPSRVWVRETAIEHAEHDLVQHRVSIDRFTGGARNTALFNEQPVFGRADTKARVSLELVEPDDHEVGLLLLLLKDLWTGDLPIGGEISVGRGRLGLQAVVRLTRFESDLEWRLLQTEQGIQVEGESRESLSGYVEHLNRFLEGGI